jgi:hypothetical protein
MLPINMSYLYLSGSLTLRPQRVIVGGEADAPPEDSATTAAATTRF